MIDIKSEILRVLFKELWRNKVLIILGTLAAAFLSLLLTELVSDRYTYRATASVCVTSGSPATSATSRRVLGDYFDITTSRRICDYAAALVGGFEINGGQVQRMLTVSLSENNYILKINATSDNARLSIEVANAAAEAIVAHLYSVTGENYLEVFDSARAATSISNNLRNSIRMVMTGGVFAALCGWVVLRELMADRVRLISQCAEDMDEILAVIPNVE